MSWNITRRPMQCAVLGERYAPQFKRRPIGGTHFESRQTLLEFGGRLVRKLNGSRVDLKW
jgi:hypothetical protein